MGHSVANGVKTYLIVGGAGYVGSHTVRALTDRGDQVIVFDNLSTGHRRSVPEAELIVGDIRNLADLHGVLSTRRIDCVMHFAALSLVGASVERPLSYYDNNVTGTLSLLSALAHYGVNRLIFSSSAAVYGSPGESPLTEFAPCSPQSPYGRSKLYVEQILKDISQTSDLRAVSLRYFNAAGAHPSATIGEDHHPETHLIPLVLEAAAGQRRGVEMFGTDWDTPDGTCLRDYVHVCDLAQAHVLASDWLLDGHDSDVFNVGTGSGLSVRQTIELGQAVTGRPFPVECVGRRPGDPASLIACGEKIRHVLGWKPKLSEPATLMQTAWEWHRRHPEGFGDQA